MQKEESDNEKEVDQEAKSVDMVSLFSSVIFVAKRISAAAQIHIKKKQEGLFRFLHQSTLLSNNTTLLLWAAGRYALLGCFPGVASSEIRRPCVWKQGFQYQVPR